jgi:hypothetical protein
MLVLNSATWIRFAVWMTIGFIIYFAYGIMESSENSRNKTRSRKDSSSSGGEENPAFN